MGDGMSRHVCLTSTGLCHTYMMSDDDGRNALWMLGLIYNRREVARNHLDLGISIDYDLL